MDRPVQTDRVDSLDQRADQRQACDVPVEWGCFNASKQFHGRMTDASARGGCVESDQPIIPGAPVFIRLMAPDGLDDAFRSVMLAEVKWCNDLPVMSSWHYRIGVKCFEYL